MSSRVKTLRDEITTAIAAIGAVAARSIVPTAVWIPPERDRADVDTEIVIAPAGREVVLEGRALTCEIFTFHVAIFQPFLLDTESADATTEKDQLLVEGIIDGTVGVRLTSGICFAAEQKQIADVENWRTKRLFTSIVELKYR